MAGDWDVDDRFLLHLVVFVVFFPFSAIVLAAAWVIRKTKDRVRETQSSV